MGGPNPSRKGYSVRGVVRKQDKAAYLFKLQGSSYSDLTDRSLRLRSSKTSHASQSTVSKLRILDFRHRAYPDEIIIPVVNGTTGVMNSALKYGTSVRRIVVTSSTVAVNTFPSSPEVYDETNWNETATANVEKLGRDANNMEKYCASKTLAEKAAWRLYEDNKAKGTWLFSLLHIFGPVLREIESADQLNTPMAHRHDLVLKGSPDESESLANDGLAWVDVRDLALADWRRWGLVESESSYPPDCTRIKTGVIHFSLLNEIGI